MLAEMSPSQPGARLPRSHSGRQLAAGSLVGRIVLLPSLRAVTGATQIIFQPCAAGDLAECRIERLVSTVPRTVIEMGSRRSIAVAPC